MTLGDILAGKGLPDPDVFVAAFWLGAEDVNRRYEALQEAIPDTPASFKIAEIRAKASANRNFHNALASIERIRSGRDPAPDRFRTAFLLGFAATLSRSANRTLPSEWRERSKRVELALAQLENLSASIDALDSDLIHGPKDSRAALGTPSSETPREAIRVLRKWIEQNRPDSADTAERETTFGDGRGERPAWPLRKMAKQLTGLLDHLLDDPCTSQTAQIIRAFTGATLSAKDIDSLRR